MATVMRALSRIVNPGDNLLDFLAGVPHPSTVQRWPEFVAWIWEQECSKVAAAVDVSRQTVMRWTRGARPGPWLWAALSVASDGRFGADYFATEEERAIAPALRDELETICKG